VTEYIVVVEEEKEETSTKREITATVASVAVTIVLGIGANILIGRIGKKVHDQIAPQEEE
jgi:hypothetical protein